MVFPFERLRERLLTAGVSPRHVRRYMTELSDHIVDLEAEAKAAGDPRPMVRALERLGSPDDLAQAMIARTELKAWTARAPWAVFLFGPAALLAVIDALSTAVLMTIVKTAYQPGEVAPAWLVTVALAVNAIHAYAVPLLLGLIVAFVGAHRRMRPFWPLVGLVVIAVVAGLTYLHVDVPLTPGQHGEISLGASIGNATVIRVVSNLIVTVSLYAAWRRAFSLRSGLAR